MPFRIPFLSVGPNLTVEPTRVVAETAPAIAVLTLGLWQDRIVVDSRLRTVRIERRRFWFNRSQRTVRFDEVSHVAYALIDHGDVLEAERGGHEIFDLALTLHSQEEVPLFRYSGDGEYVSDVSLPTEWVSDRLTEITDVQGVQQVASLSAVDLLCHRIGVPIGASRYF